MFNCFDVFKKIQRFFVVFFFFVEREGRHKLMAYAKVAVVDEWGGF